MQAIQARNLTKHYGAVRALDDVSFDVGTGEVIGLLGPNGAGKTTLMKILTGYLEPDAGSARICGHDIVAEPSASQGQLGYLPEHAPLYAEMSVQGYLRMMASLRGIPDGEQRARLSEAILATGLEPMLTRPIAQLSKGFRQRVGIAQAIVHRPRLLILDEPTTGLDPAQIIDIRELIAELAKDATVLLSTHILPEVEQSCQRVLMITGGRLRVDSPLAELRSSNAVRVRVDQAPERFEADLGAVAGVDGVERLGRAEGSWQDYRVTGASDVELGPLVFREASARGWTLAELRPDTRTLEDVFNEHVRAATVADPAQLAVNDDGEATRTEQEKSA